MLNIYLQFDYSIYNKNVNIFLQYFVIFGILCILIFQKRVILIKNTKNQRIIYCTMSKNFLNYYTLQNKKRLKSFVM